VLNGQQSSPDSAGHKDSLQRQIDVVEAEIDSLVYRLYGLTDEDVKIVEGRD